MSALYTTLVLGDNRISNHSWSRNSSENDVACCEKDDSYFILGKFQDDPLPRHCTEWTLSDSLNVVLSELVKTNYLLVVGKRLILKEAFIIYHVRIWTWFVWLRLAIAGGKFKCGNGIFWYHNRRKIFWVWATKNSIRKTVLREVN